jgi:Holliday junction resolvase RusA-like endonuclease
MIQFTIPGKPVPQERRIHIRGGWAFDPPKSRATKHFVRICALKALPRYSKPSGYCFSVTLIFCGPHWGADIDNLSKLVLDAIKGVFWKDDHQVTELIARKVRAPKGDEKTMVTIEELRPAVLPDLK